MNLTSIQKQLEPCKILRPIGYYFAVLCIIGTGLNASVLFTFIRHRNLRQSSTNIFIIGLIFADFIGSITEIPIVAAVLIACRWIFPHSICIFESFTTYLTGCSNMFMICLISIDRYYVVRRSYSEIIIKPKYAYIITLGVYLLALFWTIMPLVGWSAYDYEGTGASCSVQLDKESWNTTSYNIAIFTFVYLIPIVVIVVVNIKICRIISDHKRTRPTKLSDRQAQNHYTVERRATQTVILITGGFILAWTPYAIVAFIQAFVNKRLLSPIIITIPALFCKTSAVWNPLIYVLRNGNFRRYIKFNQSDRQRESSSSSPPVRLTTSQNITTAPSTTTRTNYEESEM